MFANRCPTAPKPTQPSSVSICIKALFKIGMAALGGCRALVEAPLRQSKPGPRVTDVQRNPVADRPAAGAACASMTEAVVRCDGRRCRVRLGGRTVTSSDTTRRPPIVSDGQQNTLAAHSSGRSRVQLVNLANIAAYVVARIVLMPLSGQASEEFQFIRLGRMPKIRKGSEAIPRNGTGRCSCCQQPLQILDLARSMEVPPDPVNANLGVRGARNR
jgi:hypothetical protein